MGRKLIRFVLMMLSAVIFFFGESPGLFAQPNTQNGEVDPEKITHIINLYEVVARHPGPSWQRTADFVKESEFHQDHRGQQFILEMVPKGESFKAWNRMYAVTAIQMSGLLFKDFVNASLQPYFVACGKENFVWDIYKQIPTGGVLVLFVCQNSPSGPAQLGYGEGVGEVTLMYFNQYGSTSVRVYQHWRGKKFTASDRSTWPVKTEEFEFMARRFIEKTKIIGRSAQATQ